jgi:hypothetical protein
MTKQSTCSASNPNTFVSVSETERFEYKKQRGNNYDKFTMSQRGNESHVGTVEDIAVVVQHVQIDADLPHLFARSDAQRLDVQTSGLFDVSLQESIQLDGLIALSLETKL